MSEPEDVRALIAEVKALVSMSKHTSLEVDLADACEQLLGDAAELRVLHDMIGQHGSLEIDSAASILSPILVARTEHVAAMDRLTEALKQARELVRRLQWGAGKCELCGRGPFYGDEPRSHAPDCPIAALGLPADDE